MCRHKSFWRGTKCSQIFGLAQKIWTGTKILGPVIGQGIGDKEQLDNEQTGFKELFTEHKIVKISKKGDFRKHLGPIFGFYTKKSPRNLWSTHFMKTFSNQTYDLGIPKNKFFFLILHYCQLKKDMFWGSCAGMSQGLKIWGGETCLLCQILNRIDTL